MLGDLSQITFVFCGHFRPHKYPSLHFYCSKSWHFLTTYPPLDANVICESSLGCHHIPALACAHLTMARKYLILTKYYHDKTYVKFLIQLKQILQFKRQKTYTQFLDNITYNLPMWCLSRFNGPHTRTGPTTKEYNVAYVVRCVTSCQRGSISKIKHGGFICTFSFLISLSFALANDYFKNHFTISSKYFDMVCYRKYKPSFASIDFEVPRHDL